MYQDHQYVQLVKYHEVLNEYHMNDSKEKSRKYSLAKFLHTSNSVKIDKTCSPRNTRPCAILPNTRIACNRTCSISSSNIETMYSTSFD